MSGWKDPIIDLKILTIWILTLNVFLKNPLLYCTSEQWPIALNLTQLFQWYYHKYFWQFSSSLYCECYFSVPNRNRDLVSSKILIPLTKVPEKVNHTSQIRLWTVGDNINKKCISLNLIYHERTKTFLSSPGLHLST